MASVAPPRLYVGLHLIEGQTLTPMLLAERFTLNPVLVVISRLLVLDVGYPGRDPVCAHAGDYQDHLRSYSAAGTCVGHFLEG